MLTFFISIENSQLNQDDLTPFDSHLKVKKIRFAKQKKRVRQRRIYMYQDFPTHEAQ